MQISTHQGNFCVDVYKVQMWHATAVLHIMRHDFQSWTMPVCKTLKIEKYKLYNKAFRDTAEEEGAGEAWA